MTARSLAFALLILVAQPVFGCQCGSRPSVEEALRKRELVVTGVILGQDPAAISRRRLRYSDQGLPPSLPVTKITVGVTRVFKGDPPDTITLTHIGCCVCEKELGIGKEYLLFVRPSWEVHDAQMVTFCDPNADLAQKNVLSELPKPVRVRSDLEFKRSLAQRVRQGNDYLANVYARFLVTRLGPNPWINDPVKSLREWPWLPLFVAVALGLVLGPLVVVVRRRVRKARSG